MGPGGGWGHPFPGWGSAGGGFLQADCATIWPLSLRSSSALQTTPSHRLPFSSCSFRIPGTQPTSRQRLVIIIFTGFPKPLAVAGGSGAPGHPGPPGAGWETLGWRVTGGSWPLGYSSSQEPGPGTLFRSLVLGQRAGPGACSWLCPHSLVLPRDTQTRGWIFKRQSRKALPHGFLHSLIQHVVIEPLLYTRPSAGAGWGPRGRGERTDVHPASLEPAHWHK